MLLFFLPQQEMRWCKSPLPSMFARQPISESDQRNEVVIK